jgi:signal transduction histidine kinase
LTAVERHTRVLPRMASSDPFPQCGEMSALITSKTWSDTPLGAPSTWPLSLRTALRVVLASRYPMCLGWGPELTYFYNDAFARQTLGDKHPAALGRPAREVWAESWGAVAQRIDHVMTTGEATWNEELLCLLERNGYQEETYHTSSYSPVPGDAPGEMGGILGVVAEVTERVIGERRIALLRNLASGLGHTKSSEAVFAAVEGCLTADARDIPFSISYLFEDDDAIARRASQTGFDPPHLAVPERVVLGEASAWPFESVLATGEPTVIELGASHVWPAGAWKKAPSHALIVPIAEQGGARPAGVFIAGVNPHRSLDQGLRSFVDLFVGQLSAGLANARAHEESRRRAAAFAELDRAKTAFFSSVSHEFRTPLTLMLGPTEDALGTPDGLRGAELELVHRNQLRLLKLVEGLLAFARIETGRIQASYEPTDLRALTVDLASTFRAAIERAGIVFDVRCAELSAARRPFYVDHDMWEAIVLNLLSNALKFTFEGGISVVLTEGDDGAELRIEDTGVGIAPDEIGLLFERFHRSSLMGRSRARARGGSGIGLALVHELVRLHGGRVEVQSKVEHGTVFTVSIPRGAAHLPPDRVGAPRAPAPSRMGTAYVEEAMRWPPAPATDPPIDAVAADAVDADTELGARILVADGDGDMREYIARLLRQHHWTVEVVSDGVAALEAARRAPPALILSEVMMSRLHGFGLIRELRGDPRTATTPIVLLSSHAGEDASAQGLRAGADDYLVKPFTASALLVRVEAQLSAARLREAIRRTAEAERVRLQAMFYESPAAIAMLRGPALVIELANPSMLDLWGKTTEIIGMSLSDAIPELHGQGFDEALLSVLETGAASRGTEIPARLYRRGFEGLQEGYFDIVYAPLYGADGAPDGVFVHAYDVTDTVLARRNAEDLREAERQARHDAEAANRLKDEFLATMSHELRTPLNAILGWASLLRRGRDNRKSRERALSIIERNARAQERLIGDILDVSRIVSGKLRLDLRRVDTQAIAHAALAVVRPAAEAKGVTLAIEHEPEDGITLVGDADRLQQIVWNLLSNAVKFTPPEGRVVLRIEQEASTVRFIVRDTGAGIAPEHLPFIFERFRQIDSSTTRKYGGLGLGLAIVRHLVELHGGVVTAESVGLGEGAAFTVSLPIRALHERAPDERAPDQVEPPGAVQAAVTSLAGIEVLVVDDDEDSRDLVESALERAGASVTAVGSAVAALAVLETQRVDVLISDIGMPDEDGFTLMRRLRARACRGRLVPAIALTAYARGEDASRALDVGFQRHLAKPADVDVLARTVAALAEGARVSA